MTRRSQLVALLRGINVGGNKRVSMAELRALAEDLGLADVRTYIQSGNLIFASPESTAKLEQDLEAAIVAHFGFDVPVIVRPLTALVRAAKSCPFADEAEQRPNLVHIGFAKGKIAKAAAAAVADYCKAGERVAVQGQVIWVDSPSGVAGSKLTPAVLDRAFGSSVTMRNAKTLRAILAT